ncbi:hypothetical protein JB92DRAFT_3135560 [Gautieria morchelliformis]|nr:hypothetical protein JB92DRAFT_3135560 [Gautieria morchelliformis]
MHPFQPLNDDSFSFSESFLTASSSSTVWGPGALSGKALKAIGGMSLDLLCHLTIRMRLAKIKRAIEKTLHVFHDPGDAIESQRMNEFYADLKELCKVKYSLSVRRAAGDLIRKITLIETPEHPGPSSSSVEKTLTQWEVLLAPLLLHGGVLFLEEVNPSGFRPDLGGLHSESLGDQNQIDDVLTATGNPQEDHMKVLKEANPSSFGSMANLAEAYWSQGWWKDAEELEVQVIEASKRILGEEHPNTLTTTANLAAIYQSVGQWKDAKELEVQVMEASKRILGEEHPDTLTATANLAAIYRSLGQWKDAEELEVQVMDASKRILGEEHPDTLTATANCKGNPGWLWRSHYHTTDKGKSKEKSLRTPNVSEPVLYYAAQPGTTLGTRHQPCISLTTLTLDRPLMPPITRVT